jgi:hypothetical protein
MKNARYLNLQTRQIKSCNILLSMSCLTNYLSFSNHSTGIYILRLVLILQSALSNCRQKKNPGSDQCQFSLITRYHHCHFSFDRTDARHVPCMFDHCPRLFHLHVAEILMALLTAKCFDLSNAIIQLHMSLPSMVSKFTAWRTLLPVLLDLRSQL